MGRPGEADKQAGRRGTSRDQLALQVEGLLGGSGRDRLQHTLDEEATTVGPPSKTCAREVRSKPILR